MKFAIQDPISYALSHLCNLVRSDTQETFFKWSGRQVTSLWSKCLLNPSCCVLQFFEHSIARKILTSITTFLLAKSILVSGEIPESGLYADHKWTTHVMHEIKPYFLSPYQDGGKIDRVVKQINGTLYVVERFNHGLAHGLRQGALAKDIVRLLARLKKEGQIFNDVQVNSLLNWAQEKLSAPGRSNFIYKLELAAAFQRSGRQSEANSSCQSQRYMEYELQDAINFKIAAQKSGLFTSKLEIQVFAEAILWSNKGTLNENENQDLKYLRRILHAAHTFDLRRIPFFNRRRIQQDGLDQLIGYSVNLSSSEKYREIVELLWDRSGAYLKATGDRDLVTNQQLQDEFFLQTQNPYQMVEAIYLVSKEAISTR